jgi:signal transduction histidine kinase
MEKKPLEKILIVDDVTKNIQILASFLKEAGYEINFALNGLSAIEHINHEHFNLILLDIMMPEMDGFEVCRILKLNPVTREIPIIFITAKTDEESIKRGFKTGGMDYITKPFNKSELLARVKTHLLISRQKKSLEELVNTKDKFFSIIAHDLKSPISQLSGLSDVLISLVKTDSEIKKIATMIRNSAQAGNTLLNNLMEWARSQTGRITFNPEVFDLKILTDEIIDLNQSISAEKNISLTNNIPSGTTAYGDKNMLRTVIRNIVSNGIKFTPKNGKIEVSTTQNGKYTQVHIRDNGIGMKKEDVDKLFKIGVNLNTIGESKEKGTGLGLILCKEFIDHHNGKIWAVSQINTGTEFIFAIPRQ